MIYFILRIRRYTSKHAWAHDVNLENIGIGSKGVGFTFMNCKNSVKMNRNSLKLYTQFGIWVQLHSAERTALVTKLAKESECGFPLFFTDIVGDGNTDFLFIFKWSSEKSYGYVSIRAEF